MNKQDPWPHDQVVSALESYEGRDNFSELVKEVKKEKVFMCHHNE